MGDKWIASVDEHHRVMDSNSKMEQTICKIAVYNIWVFCIQYQYEHIIDFRQNLALKIIHKYHR